MYLIVSALLSFMAISGFFGKRNLSRLEIDIKFPREIYAERTFPLRIELKNNKSFLPVFLLKVRVDAHEAVFDFVNRKNGAVKYLNISFAQRGPHEFKEVHICSVFPFNFFVRCKQLKKTFRLTVFPEPRKFDILSPVEKVERLKGEKPADRAGYDADISSIRKYIHGDPLKYIDWKATAKTDELRTRELSSLSHQPVVIDFEKIFAKNTEEKISGVTYVVLQLLRKNTPVGLKISNKLYKPATSISHKIAILNELALYGLDR